MNEKALRAEILAQALPYIEKFYNSYVVIKYGGHAMLDSKAMEWTIKDTILLKYVGMKPIIVHGGGPEITTAMKKMGIEPKFISGLRVTDKDTLDVVKMVLVGKINTELVSKFNAYSCPAVGLSGKDGRLIIAKQSSPKKIIRDGEELEVDLGYVGEIKNINSEILEILTSNDYIPVISPVGLTEEGESLNLNADTVAGEIASAVKARRLIVLTDVPGVLMDVNDTGSLIKKLKTTKIKTLIKRKIIQGSMLPKIEACKRALLNDVEAAHIIDGRVSHSILLELFTDEGIGTMLEL